MNAGNREDYIKYRFHRAEECLEEAIIMIANQKWNATINRLYYACFYAVIALLLKKGIRTLTHDGARTQFGLQFVKTGLIDKQFGKLYSRLFDYRQKGDYGDLFDFDAEIVTPLVDAVKEFLNEIKKQLFDQTD